MAAKTPFEIRLELLQLAQSILSDQAWVKRNKLEMDWNSENEAFRGKYPDFPTPTSEEIITEAQKLNEFVSKGS